MSHRQVTLHPAWLQYLEAEFEQDYMQELSRFLRDEKAQGKVIYPAAKNIFAALDSTPIDSLSVVILGQDPYHGPNQAHGLSFSVPQGVAIPPSLKNIYQEIHTDLGLDIPAHGNLKAWAEQGVLLLNSVLTVQQGLAASHQGKGWERFTDAVIRVINQHTKNTVFLLWGSYAQKKGSVIDRTRHCVLTAPHPSPLSAHRGFLGCQHFSKANAYLKQQGKPVIDWKLD